MEVVLLRVEDADRRTVVFRLGQQLLGAFGVALVVFAGSRLRIERRPLGEVFARNRVEFRVAEACEQNLLVVQRHLKCLTDLQIRHRTLFGIRREVREAVGHRQDGRDAGCADTFLLLSTGSWSAN